MEIGDKVKIVRYGHLIWESKTIPGARSEAKAYWEDDKRAWIDMCPRMVGQKGTVFDKVKTQNGFQYSLAGVTGKSSWYHEEQLEKI